MKYHSFLRHKSVNVGFGFPVVTQFNILMLQNIVLVVKDRSFPSDKGNAILVVKQSHFVGCHKLSPRDLIVRGKVAPHTVASAVGVGVDSRLAELFADVLVGALFVTAEIDKLVAVADDRFPLLFKQRFELCEILQDDTDRNAS